MCAIAMNLVFGSFIVSDFRCLSQLPAGSLLPTDCCSHNKIEREIANILSTFLMEFILLCQIQCSWYSKCSFLFRINLISVLCCIIVFAKTEKVVQGWGEGFFAFFYETGHWHNFASLWSLLNQSVTQWVIDKVTYCGVIEHIWEQMVCIFRT